MTKPDASNILELRPVGRVENGVPLGERVIWEEIESRVVIYEPWVEALEGLDGFSHIVLIFWLDRPSENEVPLKVHPEAKEDLPLVGLFATRTPLRPNPIGVTSVELLGIEGDTLRVRGLDAYDGTPVLDIKPYLIRGDLKPGASAPDWLRRLWEQQDSSR